MRNKVDAAGMKESFRLLGQAQKAANEEWDAMARGIFRAAGTGQQAENEGWDT